MKHVKIASLLLGLGVLGATVAPALLRAEEPTTKPAKAPTKGKLVLPWSKLTKLSDKQKEQIIAFHQKALDEISLIHERERGEIVALLDKDQRDELLAYENAQKAEDKAKALAEKEAKDAGKEPAK